MTAESDQGTIEYEVGPDGALRKVRRLAPRPERAGEAAQRVRAQRAVEAERMRALRAAEEAKRRETLIASLGESFADYGLELVALGQLQFCYRYQRVARLNTIAQIAAKLNKVKFGVIICMRRPDGTMVVIDGQHRIQALRRLRFAEDFLVACVFLPWVSLKHEAETYLALNRERVRLTSANAYWAGLAFDDPAATAIRDVLQRTGEYVPLPAEAREEARAVGLSELAETPSTGGIQAVDALAYICGDSRGGQHMLAVVILTARGAWGKDPQAVSATVLRGTFYFLRDYQDERDFTDLGGRPELIRLLRGCLIPEVAAQGRGVGLGGHGSSTFAAGIREVWNRVHPRRRLGRPRKAAGA